MENLTQSEGFIAVALVYFGAWRPVGVMGGSVLYGLAIAVVLEWKSLGIIPLSASDLAATAPAVITILALLTRRPPIPPAGSPRKALRERRLTRSPTASRCGVCAVPSTAPDGTT